MNIPKMAVIFCGGRGTRLGTLTDFRPKPMMLIGTRPFLFHLINQLRGQGIRKVLLLTGYLGQQIQDYFRGRVFLDVEVICHQGPEEWETAQRLWAAKDLLDERFFLLYGDNFAPVSFCYMMERMKNDWGSEPDLLLTTARKGEGGSFSITLARTVYDPTRQALDMNYVDVGYILVRKETVLSYVAAATVGNNSFQSIINNVNKDKWVATFNPDCSYHSISDPERLEQTREFFKPKKIILLDRDGIINKKAPQAKYVCEPYEFEFLEENLKALQALSKEGYTFVVLTNQAGIGYNVMSASEVDYLHKWMMDRLVMDYQIPVLTTHVCPHRWNEDCPCRKPAPGLFFAASDRHQLRLDRTIYIGDDERDVIAASRATTPCVLLGKAKTVTPWLQCDNLLDAVPEILEQFHAWEGEDR